MLRVGLTGGLGSGKSTTAKLFAAQGAHILQSDAIGRELMELGQPIYEGMIAHFGPGVVLADGTLDRAALARIAFTEGRVEELNAIAHPLVIARQMELTEKIFQQRPHAVVMVESALIFETHYVAADGSRWQSRFDRIILVTAPEEVKVARFVARSSAGKTISEEQRAELEAEARRRLAQQISDEQKAALSDYVLTNGGALTELEWQVDQLWPILEAAA
ncbi:dephospho-CoA kinase [Tunturibacter empetritectus]|uniref:Dephospho-CoA kinase n=1 Tax=Tunturiibacter empetritectus TaxID=3069691 RepID=A0A7W8IJD7_9BACT|nr:dephospho-CoA kinase [Edaphobacter lichenicola]MBB5317273.1 dephospho-CoA kinase [Edaphobacter lichenicola]